MWFFNNHSNTNGHQSYNSGRNNTQCDGCRSNNYFGRPNNLNWRSHPKCQICDQLGHTTNFCPQYHSHNAFANYATISTRKDKTWLLDIAASYNITGDISNLSIHFEYDGTNKVILGDGSGLLVSHIGSLALHSPHRTFTLCDTLYVPNLCKNLVYVHHLTN